MLRVAYPRRIFVCRSSDCSDAVTRAVRRRPALLCAIFAIASVSQLAACRVRHAAPSVQATASDGAHVGDTVRGIVSIVESEPLTTVQLTTAAGVGWHLVGDSLDAVRAAAGLEIMVRGGVLMPDRAARPSARFDAVRFVVRSADGIAAQDGVLERDGAGFALRLADDRRASLTAVPVPLREQVGARIWWAGRLDRAPVAYGVLIARR